MWFLQTRGTFVVFVSCTVEAKFSLPIQKYASVTTADALHDKLGLHFCGAIKAGHKFFPQEEIRWTLVDAERGLNSNLSFVSIPLN